MKRFYIAAVVGLCAVAPGLAQEGALAPTVPVVPSPMLQNGNLVAPAGGSWGTSGSRVFSHTTWSPVRSPVVASETSYATTGYAVPPLPTGVGSVNGQCGPTTCGTVRSGVNWDRLKAWLCYHPSKTELPRLQPAPYVTSIRGMFSCASGSGCAPGSSAQPAFIPPAPSMMTPPAGAGAVMMPPRGTQGAAVQPTWQGRTLPAPAPIVNAGYRPGQK